MRSLFNIFIVQIEEVDSSTDHNLYPDSDDTIVFSFSSDESSDDEHQVCLSCFDFGTNSSIPDCFN